MNNDFELENMRQQMNTLKKKLEDKKIVNDRILRRSTRKDVNSITRRYYVIMAICLIMIPYGYWAFVKLNGSSIGVWITMSILMLITLVYTVYIGRHLHNSNLYDRDLVDAYKKVAQAKRLDSEWLKFGIPAVILWLGYFLYDSYGHMERDEFEIFAVAMSVAVILGGIIGLKIHFRNLKSEVLYVYALLHPRGFLRESLNRPGCPKLANLYTILYMADPRILVNQASQNFDRMISQAISDARRSIEEALIFAEELSFGNPRHYDMKIVIPAVYDGLKVILDQEISAYQ